MLDTSLPPHSLDTIWTMLRRPFLGRARRAFVTPMHRLERLTAVSVPLRAFTHGKEKQEGSPLKDKDGKYSPEMLELLRRLIEKGELKNLSNVL